MRTARWWTAALTGLALLSGCAETQYVTCNVESTPTSAEVWVSGEGGPLEQRDSTPCGILFSDPGVYEVHVKKPGYLAVMRRVTIIEEEQADAEPTLKVLPTEMIVTLDPVDAGGGAAAGGAASEPEPYYYGD